MRLLFYFLLLIPLCGNAQNQYFESDLKRLIRQFEFNVGDDFSRDGVESKMRYLVDDIEDYIDDRNNPIDQIRESR